MRICLSMVILWLLALVVGACGPEWDLDDESSTAVVRVAQASEHMPGNAHGRRDSDSNDNDEDNCFFDEHCNSGKKCSQGGRCIDVTGTESVLSELQADIDELPEAVGMGVPYELPTNAILRIDDENGDGLGLLIDNGIILEGNGSRLVVENDMVAIRLLSGAQWSSVKNLRIQPQTRAEHTGIGIDVRAHGLRLENIWVQHMGTGVRAHTYANDLGHANVNTQQWNRIILSNNYHYGMHVRSGDSNAGLFSGIEVLGGAGIQDDSFLGNNYIAPVITSDTGPSLNITSGASSSTVVGMYLEDNSPNPTAASNHDLHLGGNSIHRLETQGDRVGRMHSRLRFQTAEGTGARIPGGPFEPISFWHPAEDNEWRIRYFPSPRQWRIFHNGGGPSPYRWTAETHSQGPGLYELGEEMQ